MENLNIKFLEQKSKFLHLAFVQNDIEIRPLQNVRDFIQEGTTLNHCVAKESYICNTRVLILSARINGERTETIEFDLQQMKAMHVGGYSNDLAEHHKEIMKVLEKNIPAIKEIVIPKKKKNANKLQEVPVELEV